jgi:outer membrane protein assembly factor BamB
MANFSPTPVHLWSANLGAPTSYAVIAQGEVYVTAGTDAQQSVVQLEALNQITGHLDWNQTLTGHSVFSEPSASPVYDNGMVFLLNQDEYNSTLDAYNANTGSLLWSTVPGQFQTNFTTPPVATNGIVYFTGYGDGSTVYAMRESDGSLLWSSTVESGSTPTVFNGTVYVNSVGNVSALSSTTGKILWQYFSGVEGGGSAMPVYSNGQLFIRDIYSPINNDSVMAFNATSGKEQYTFAPNVYPQPPTPALYNGTGYLEENGQIQAFAPANGTIIWTKSLTNDQFATAPIVVNGVVYDGTADGELYALDGSTGAVISETSVGTSFTNEGESWPASPLPGLSAGDGLLVASAGDTVNVYSIVPEPSVAALFSAVLCMLCWRRWRLSDQVGSNIC